MSIWNDGVSPHETLIRNAYAEAGYGEWDNDAIGKLCQRVQCSREVLLALCGVERKKGLRYWSLNRWPVEIGLHFSLIESIQSGRETGGVSTPGAQHAALAKIFSSNPT